MRAVAWHGKHDVRVDTVDDPEILNPRDAIIRVTSTAICGADLHLYDGYIPTMKAGKDTIISGWSNKMQVAAAGVLPQSVPAEMHRDMAEPGSGKRA